MRHVAVLSLILLGACAGNPEPVAPVPAPTPAPAPVPAPEPVAKAPAPVLLSADTPEATPAGAAFNGPAGWTFATDAGRAVLTGPEPDLQIAIVDAAATKADDAVAAAWAAFHPGFKWPLKVVNARPGRHGWEERRDYDYETSPDEKLVIFARAVRKGNAWTVLLIKGGEASVDKRGAAVGRVWESLRPAGYTRETFAGKVPHKLDADRIKQIVDAMDRARDKAAIPGVALALVQDGKVVFEGGLGVRELGKPDKVDAHTRFMIASNTKALTTLLLAKLVDEGKLTWESQVTSLFPSFKLGDACDDARGARQAPHLRVHRAAAAGPRVALRLREADAAVGARRARDDAADDQVRRDVPVQ